MSKSLSYQLFTLFEMTPAHQPVFQRLSGPLISPSISPAFVTRQKAMFTWQRGACKVIQNQGGAIQFKSSSRSRQLEGQITRLIEPPTTSLLQVVRKMASKSNNNNNNLGSPRQRTNAHQTATASSKWQDLGEQHIVRAANIYSNIPITKSKQLNAVLQAHHRGQAGFGHATFGGTAKRKIKTNSTSSAAAHGGQGASSKHTKETTPSNKVKQEQRRKSQKASTSKGVVVGYGSEGDGDDGCVMTENSKKHAEAQEGKGRAVGRRRTGSQKSLKASHAGGEAYKSSASLRSQAQTPVLKSQNFSQCASHTEENFNLAYPVEDLNGVIEQIGSDFGHQTVARLSEPANHTHELAEIAQQAKLAGQGKRQGSKKMLFVSTANRQQESLLDEAERLGEPASPTDELERESVEGPQTDHRNQRKFVQNSRTEQITSDEKRGSLTSSQNALYPSSQLTHESQRPSQQDFNIDGRDSRAAYFGQTQHGSASFQVQSKLGGLAQRQQIQQQKSTSRGRQYLRDQNHDERQDSSRKLRSPTQSNKSETTTQGFYTSSKTQQSRRKDGGKSGARTGTESHGKGIKSVKKKINEMNRAYDARSMVVPSVNGGMIRTSAQELRALNAYPATSSNHQLVGAACRGTGKAQSRKAADIITQKKRLSSHGPLSAYKEKVSATFGTKVNQLVSTGLRPAAAGIKLGSGSDFHHSVAGEKERSCDGQQREDQEEDTENHHRFSRSIEASRVKSPSHLQHSEGAYKRRQKARGSPSMDTDKNSLPEIGNRSMAESSICGIEESAQRFYPRQLGDSFRDPNDASNTRSKSRDLVLAPEITISEENQALASLQQDSSVIDHSAFVDNNITQEDIQLGKQVKTSDPISLPRITKQVEKQQSASNSSTRKQTLGKAGQKNGISYPGPKQIRTSKPIGGAGPLQSGSSARSKQTTAPVSNISNARQKRRPVGVPINEDIPKSPVRLSKVNQVATSQSAQVPGLQRKETSSTRGNKLFKLDPLQEEEVSAERTIIEEEGEQVPGDTESCLMSSQKKSLGPVHTEMTASLKPLNHTPNTKQPNAGSLVSATKTFYDKASSASVAADMRKAQLSFRKQSTNVVAGLNTRAGEAKTEKRLINDGSLASPKQASKDKASSGQAHLLVSRQNRDKSPIRLGTLEAQRSAAVQGLGIASMTQTRTWKETRDWSVVAQSLTAEPYYRRAMKRLGWTQIAQNESNKAFHIRFTISDLDSSVKDLQARHFYNHFPQNRELVTKMGLCKNLWFNCYSEHEMRISHIFPRCYDLSVPQQAETFIADFNQTAILSIIKIMAGHFLRRNQDLEGLLSEYERIAQFNEPELLFKPRFRKKCQRVDMRSSAMGNLLGISEVRDAYSFGKDYCNSIQFKTLKKVRAHKFSRSSTMRFSENQIQAMVKFQAELVDLGIPSAGFATYEQFKIVRLHRSLTRLLPQYEQIDGTHNIWIVKPSYNARGHGIYLTRQIRDILRDSDKQQQKVVQKYIERPLCLTASDDPPKSGGGEMGKKFDIRQWVLVNSWEPLDACVFESAYLKVCGSAFDLKNLGDVYRHLSNYSLQKENGEKEELVMSSRQFEEYMRSTSSPNSEQTHFSWKEDVLPKINDVVWRTLKSVQENIEQKANCFEVYGFDIALDQDLNPWVIEVNLSPACSERADWLTQMLNDSCTDLLGHIQSRIALAHPPESWTGDMAQVREQASTAPHRTTKNLNAKSFYEGKEIYDRWIRLPQAIQEIKEFHRVAYLDTVPQKGLQFELVGEKADLRYERKLERGYRQERSAAAIQRVWRGYHGKLEYTRRLKNKCAIVIQKNTRTFLAKCALHRLRQHKCAIIVQRQLRRLLALQEADRLRAMRILAQKTHIVTKLQTRFRMGKAKAFVHQVRQQKASLRFQRHVKGYLARKKAAIERFKKCMVIRLQLFIKHRHRIKHRSAQAVQRHLKGLLSKRQVGKYLKIAQGAQSLSTLVHAKWQQGAVLRLQKHSKAIVLQRWIRMRLAFMWYKAKLQLIAQGNLRQLFRIYTLQQLVHSAFTLREVRDSSATVVQRQLKGYLAAQKLTKMRKTASLNSAATLVKRFMRSFLARKEAKRRRIKIGASIMIQALYRGFALRKHLAIQRMWEEEKRVQEQSKKRRKDSKRNSVLGSGSNHASRTGRQSQNSQYGLAAEQEIVASGKRHERTTRYLSNPSKFVSKSKMPLAQQHSQPSQARHLAKQASQGNLMGQLPSQSNISLRQQPQYQEESATVFNTNKFSSQHSGNKRRKVVKKGGGASKREQQKYELGLRHLQNAQGLVTQVPLPLEKGQYSAKNAASSAMNQVPLDNNYQLLKAQKVQAEASALIAQQQQHLMSAQSTSQATRLGSKIASTLQRQNIKALMYEQPQLKSFKPIEGAKKGSVQRASEMVPARTSFDDRLDHVLIQTIGVDQMAIQQNQSQSPLPAVVAKPNHTKTKLLQIDTRQADKAQLEQQSDSAKDSNAARTPVVKSLTTTKSKQMCDERQSLHLRAGLRPQKSNHALGYQNLDPVSAATGAQQVLPPVQQQSKPQQALNSFRKSFEGNAAQDIQIVTQKLEKNRSGKGIATTLVMRKNPSKGSLHSARDSTMQEAMPKTSGTVASASASNQRRHPSQKSQYKQHLALCHQIDQKGSTHNLLKKTKEKSKQIKNLERIVQCGAAYMHPMSKPAIFRNTNSQLRDKLTEQQKQLISGGAPSSGVMKSSMASAPTKQGKSFAKYLNEMLESQARQSTNSKDLIFNASVVTDHTHMLKTQQSCDTNEALKKVAATQDSRHQLAASSTFSSKGSIKQGMASGGLTLRQTEYKPILVKESGSSAERGKLPQLGQERRSEAVAIHGRNQSGEQNSVLDMSRGDGDGGAEGVKQSITAQTSFVNRGLDTPQSRQSEIVHSTIRSESINSITLLASSHPISATEGCDKSEKSEFMQQLEEQKRQRVLDSRQKVPAKASSYTQAQAIFNKTKDNFLEQIKRSQDQRYEAINEAHKKQRKLLAAVQLKSGSSVSTAQRPNEGSSYRADGADYLNDSRSSAHDASASQYSRHTDNKRGAGSAQSGAGRQSKNAHNTAHNFHSKKSTASSGRPSAGQASSSNNNMVVI